MEGIVWHVQQTGLFLIPIRQIFIVTIISRSPLFLFVSCMSEFTINSVYSPCNSVKEIPPPPPPNKTKKRRPPKMHFYFLFFKVVDLGFMVADGTPRYKQQSVKIARPLTSPTIPLPHSPPCPPPPPRPHSRSNAGRRVQSWTHRGARAVEHHNISSAWLTVLVFLFSFFNGQPCTKVRVERAGLPCR